MKKQNILFLIVIIFMFIAFVGTYVYYGGFSESEPEIALNSYVDMEPEDLVTEETILTLVDYGAKGALEDDALTIVDMLRYAVQDEYLARREYQLIIETFDTGRPYSSIVLSEETHLSYLREIYASYDMDFPDDTSVEHIVVPSSLLDAAETGVSAEIDNIAMYEKFLEYDLPESVTAVFTILRDGSKNHLRAFQNQVDKLGE